MLRMEISGNKRLFVGAVSENIVRVVYTGRDEVQNHSCMVEHPEKMSDLQKEEREGKMILSYGKIRAEIEKGSGTISWYRNDSGKKLLQEGEKSLTPVTLMKYQLEGEKPVIDHVHTVDGERNFIQNLIKVKDRDVYRGKLGFRFLQEEGIYGLGQGEEGIYNYRGHTQYLYQHNMRIPMPCFVSDNGYGILADCTSLMTFESQENESHFFFDAVEQMDYYFIAGDNMDEVIRGFRFLTGKAKLLPRWAYGYLQSKEAYKSQQELIDITAEYRRRQVPLDAVIQDWCSWEDGNWGEKILDKKRYPDMKAANEEISRMHAHSMVSIWPTMTPGGKNYEELAAKGHMLMDFTTYDAFNEEARKIYFDQTKSGLLDEGFEGWWCDSTEPFSGPDWCGEIKKEPWERYLAVGEEHKKYLGALQANAYALFHSRGIYENQRKVTEEKRVMNLTRSGYPSTQKYGTVLWSGDTSATWDTLAVQVKEGLNMAMSGIPYWTLDIGGFFTVHKKWQNRGCGCDQDPSMKWFWKGDYEEGVKDLGYRELYTRWLQFAVFLPVFRSHGTDTPREIWQFGKKGEPFYDAIEKAIRLRYELMPYIYSLAAQVYFEDATIMRSLLFDFADDEAAKKIWDEFLFGKNLLICPVLEPLYYEKESRKLEKEKARTCYLPEGCDWYDFWSGRKYDGGQWIQAEATLDKIPVFVKEGTVLALSGGIQYADERPENGLEIRVYPGKNAEFTLYEDAGNGYGFEKGEYAVTKFRWKENEKKLIKEKREGSYPGMGEELPFRVVVVE